MKDYKILHKGLLDRFKFWLLGGNREIIYPDRVEYRTGAILSKPLWGRIYTRWFWRYKPFSSQKIDGEAARIMLDGKPYAIICGLYCRIGS